MADTYARMRQIAGLAPDWAAHDLVLGHGEIALEVDPSGATTPKLKIGDGAKRYSQLPFFLGEGSAAALQAILAAEGGAGQVGTRYRRTVETKLREIQVSCADFAGDDPTGATNSDAAIQAAMDEVSAKGGGSVFIPPPGRLFRQLTPRSGVTLYGIRGASVLKQQTSTTDSPNGIWHPPGSGALKNFHLRDLGFDGQRIASPFNAAAQMIWFDAGAGDVIEKVTITRCDFADAQDNFTYFSVSNLTGLVRDCEVSDCTAITTTAKRALGGTSTPVSMDLMRTEQTFDYGTAGDGYGKMVFANMRCRRNVCESIRTCGDIKRGCSGFDISGNLTRNMFDCHQSSDGSWNGTITRNVCRDDATYTGPSNNNNAIEIQGEHVVCTHNDIDGGGKRNNSIYVTDYGRTQEPNNRGHVSVSVLVAHNTTKAIVSNCYRMSNPGPGCAVLDCFIDTALRPAVIESGTTRNNNAGVALQAQGARIAGVRSANCTQGAYLMGAAVACSYGACLDENGEDFNDCNVSTPAAGGSTFMTLASSFASFRNTDNPTNLCANPWLDWTGSSPSNAKYWTTVYPALVAAVTKPANAPAAVTISDTDAVNIQAPAYTVAGVKNQRLYVRVGIKGGTGPSFAVFVTETDANDVFLANYFYGVINMSTITSYTEYVAAHKVQAANCAKAVVKISPCTSFNDGTKVGTTDVANVRIGRSPFGVGT